MTDDLAIVIAGAGRFGTLHARVWREAGASIAGVVDVAENRAAQLADQYGAVSGSDLARVIGQTGAGAVVVASDEATHAGLAGIALESGCHVFVEKPFSLTTADAERLEGMAEERGLHAFAGHISRFAQAYAYLKQALDAGRLGTLWALRLRRDFSRSWFASFGARVHPVWESCIHDIDLAIHLAGSRPARLYATQSAAAGEAAPSVLALLLEFDNGVTATIESAWAVPDRAPQTLAGALALDGTIAAECEVIGSRGTVKQRLVNDSIAEWTDDGVLAPDLSLWPDQAGRIGGAIRAEVDEAIAVFRGIRPPTAMPTREAVWSVMTAEAVLRSLEQRIPVEIR